MIAVTDVGWRAQTALDRAPGSVRVLAALSASVYLTVADEIVWLGPPGSSLHPRAMLTADALPTAGRPRISLHGARPWRPPALPDDPGAATTLGAAARIVTDGIAELGVPDGFGALLAGRTPGFPLDGAVSPAMALARACATDDPEGALRAAEPLLGLGPGLTPAGDDYVGGVFFARVQLARLERRAADGWRRAADDIRRQARRRTHPISAALLGDLLEGEGHAPLHDLAVRLAAGRPRDEVREAGRRLTRIGHSSGWDMLAGFVAGLGQLGEC